jgi:hypothetical protein
MTSPDIEEFWDDLLAFVDEGRVIPVVGAALLSVMDQGREVPLYRMLAERLLEKYRLKAASADAGAPAGDNEVVLRPRLEINDAVCAITVLKDKRIQDLYRPINDQLRAILGPQPILPEALRALAGIPAFDLFVTTTCDDLLARALDEVRGGGSPVTQQILYAPNLPGDQAGDIPERRSSNNSAVFYLFGRASPSPFYSIHEEDTLEFVYNLQAGRRNLPERLLSEVRNRNLLLIGCNFADWLARFFIRLSNQVRLSGDRPKKEFLVDQDEASDRDLTLFLQRFSQNTRVHPGDARTFVAELARRWHERHPADIQSAGMPPSPEQPPGAGDIFISYSRTDLPAARVLFEELKQIGAGVIWFDKSLLKPGDEWESEILAALKRCALFLPLLSSTTEQRNEGFFRREWKEAAKRSEMIQGRKFIFPMVVDLEFDGNADRYRLVPDQFRSFQFGHAPGGHMSDDLSKAITDAIRNLRRQRAA